MTTSWGVTGPKDLSSEEREFVLREFVLLLKQERPSEVVSGAQKGTDALCAFVAEAFGIPVIRLVIPRLRLNGNRADNLPVHNGLLKHALGTWDGTVTSSSTWLVEYGKPGVNPGNGYLLRDDLTVARSGALFSTPPSPREVSRGGRGAGTWATIRRGRKKGIEVRKFYLDGSPTHTDCAREALF